MSKATQAQAPAQPEPGQHIMQVACGYYASISLWAVVELNVPDSIADAPRPVAELARECGAHEDALYRVLRLLASVGIFTEAAPREFAHTPPSRTLRSDAPNSMRSLAHWISDPMHCRIYAELMHSIRTGQPCAEKVLGAPIFDYFPKDPRESEIFNRAMISISQMVVPAVLEAYDFSGIGTLVDVAGGHGGVLFAILKKYPQMRGVLTDLEHVLAGARVRAREVGVEDRVKLEPCDFFKAVPAGGDAYIMKHIIHDWDDERAVTILRNIHTAIGSKPGKVILLEAVLAPGNEPHFGKFIDLEMLALTSGRERSEAEFRVLFERAGFRMTRVVPNNSPLSVVEAEKA